MSTETSSLTLGWRVDGEDHPAYWLRPEARAGGQSDEDLVRIPASQAARHTGIIAQSGSGKSFLLGRLVEEILLNTRARVVILDPNADFRAYDALNRAVWDRPGYDPKTGLGMLPTEGDFGLVEAAWQAIPKRIARGDMDRSMGSFEPMQIWWPLLTMDLFAEDVGPAEGVELRHCHSFLRALEVLLEPQLASGAAAGGGSNPLLDKGQDLLFRLMTARRSDGADRTALRDQLAAAVSREETPELGRALDRAVMAAQYVSPEVGHYYFYFARARECELAGILRPTPPPDWQTLRSFALDLPSLPNPELRLVVVYQILARLWAMQREAWQQAMTGSPSDDRRVPCFVVVDEAHNLIPAEPRSRGAQVLRETFRTIAAEGRKFGLFLIVVSQRPDKLDPMILSECENKIVMRIDSADVLEKIQTILGASASVATQLSDCLRFRVGRGLLFGSWAPAGPVKFIAAARRTMEGGRNLNPRWWAQPPA
jgi:hypothetical protein